MSQNLVKKSALFMLGSFILVLGVALVLVWWQDVAVLFRGAIGMTLALAGMLVLYSLNNDKSKN